MCVAVARSMCVRDVGCKHTTCESGGADVHSDRQKMQVVRSAADAVEDQSKINQRSIEDQSAWKQRNRVETAVVCGSSVNVLRLGATCCDTRLKNLSEND